MKIRLICIGKTTSSHILEGLTLYLKRLKHYISFEIIYIADIKKGNKLPLEKRKHEEGQLILKQLVNPATACLLDDKGKQYSSINFAEFLQQKINAGLATLDFIIGGAYGFSNDLYKQVNQKISFSKMTLSHELIRLVFCEQLYRAMTIQRNEPYHHE